MYSENIHSGENHYNEDVFENSSNIAFGKGSTVYTNTTNSYFITVNILIKENQEEQPN